ncbi:MAG: hypothetical protein Q9220_006724 [cf. Caloplaca sp. 1 TL-2023]
MRFSTFGLLALAVIAPCAQAIKLYNKDAHNFCVLIEIHGDDQGYQLCAPESADMSKIPAGTEITIWAGWNAQWKDICGWSSQSLTFKMPGSGGDLKWQENRLYQDASSK